MTAACTAHTLTGHALLAVLHWFILMPSLVSAHKVEGFMSLYLPQSILAAFMRLSFVLLMETRAAELVRGHKAGGFPWCCDITAALGGPVTLATGTQCTASVPSLLYLFTLGAGKTSHWYAHCNIISSCHTGFYLLLWISKRRDGWKCNISIVRGIPF